MSSMNSRERIWTTINHCEPDRIPYDLSATPVTGIHHIAYKNLRKALKLPEPEITIWHLMQQLAWVEDDVLERMQVDARGLRPKASSNWKLQIDQDKNYYYYADEWGIIRRMQKEDGLYYDLHKAPLENAQSADDIKRYPFPDPIDPARFVGIRELAEKAQAEGRIFILGGISAGMLEMGMWLRGFENFLCDLYTNRSLAEALCDKILELKMRYWEKALSILKGLVEVLQEGDDYGGQNGLLIPPPLWREMFKPRLKQLLSYIKSQASVKVFFHSCGSIHEIIPDLIEAGVDILNPVQVSAYGMDSKRLKREFGSSLTFWGGGVDTQWVLSKGTPQQVRDEVKRRIDDFAPGGGFVFNTVHNIQADVPAENIIAMREAVWEHGGY